MKLSKLILQGMGILVTTIPVMLHQVHAAEFPANSADDNMSQLLDMPLEQLTQIVVTGTSASHGMLKQEAGYAITTASEQAMRDIQPNNAADVTRLIPGMWAETTGGVSGPNVDVRGFPTTGDTPWVSVQLDGLSIFPVSSISWMDNFTPFRLDDTVQRMEATISGPAVLWGTGQPGATVNFIQKNGLDNPGGSLRYTTGTGDLARFDGYYGGKIADDWYASVGGFYRQDQGVRNTQYLADQGYQLVGTLTHLIDGGKMTLYGRATDDKNAFFTDIPLLLNGSSSGGSIAAYPGFNPLTATLYGNNTRYVTLNTAPGQTDNLDMAKGRGIDSHIIGFDFDKKIGDDQFTDKMSYTSGSANTVRQESGPLPQTLSAFIASEVSMANNNATVLNAANNIHATGGVATFANSGQVITNLNQEVIAMNIGNIDKQFTAYQNEARLSVPVGDKNTLTIGGFYASYSDIESDEKGAYQLMQLQNNPQVINLTLNNGVLATSNDGIFAPITNANYFSMNGINFAGILEDDWQFSQRLRLDLGLRLEHNTVNGTGQNTATGDVSSDPLALYSYGTKYRVAGTTSYSYDGTAHALSTGADYEIEKNLNGFLRYNQGYQFPNFDSVQNNQDNITRVDQMQGGIKMVTETYSAFITGFYGKFTGQPQEQTLVNGTSLSYLLSAETKGIEFEGIARPGDNWQLSLLGDYMHGILTAGGPGITGNTIDQQPTLQARFTPSYVIPTSMAQFRLYTTATYVGQRWSDPQNTQRLPPYSTLDIGVVANFQNNISLQLTGTNVTNTLAITEGNPRVVGSGIGTGNVFLGRPLFGANYQLSVVMLF